MIAGAQDGLVAGATVRRQGLPLRRLVGAVIAMALLSACTIGDGDGPRYIGRVVSVTASEVCVGPSSSSSNVTCGQVPDGVHELPNVGECVGLFPAIMRAGKILEWSRQSLRRRFDDRACAGRNR